MIKYSDIPHKKIKFSIITAVRNGEEFIDQTIKSVIQQDYNLFEYIVVDGKSSDSTLSIAKKYSNRIAHLISESDRGISDAFNKGVELATGEYILILNADDRLIHQSVLSDIAKLISDNDFPLLVYGDAELVDRNTDEKVAYVSRTLSKNALKFGKIIPHPSLFTHRDYFKDFGYFDLTYKVAMDYEWLLRGALKVTSLHTPFLVTKVRSGGLSAVNSDLGGREITRALQKNNFYSSIFEELLIVGYFKARKNLKKILITLGLKK